MRSKTRMSTKATTVCATTLSILTMFFVGGTSLIIGVVYAELIAFFKRERGVTATVGSVMEFTYGGGCIVAPCIINRLGAPNSYLLGTLLYVGGILGSGMATALWGWVLTFGFLVGPGMAILFMVQLETLHLFTPESQRGLCVGLGGSGGGLGSALLGVWLTYSVSVYGLQTSMFTYAGMSGACLLSQTVLIYSLYASGEKVVSEKFKATSPSPQSCLGWFCDPRFLLLLVALFLYLSCFSVPQTHLVQFAKDRGVTKERSSLLPSIFGLSNGLGRLLFAQLGDVLDGQYLRVFITTVLGNALPILFLPLCGGFSSLAVFAAVCGLHAGGRSGVLSLVCVELFGSASVSQVYGLLCFAFLFAQPLGSPLVGHIKDVTESYTPGFLLTSGLMLCAIIPLLALDKRRVSRGVEMQPPSSDTDTSSTFEATAIAAIAAKPAIAV